MYKLLYFLFFIFVLVYQDAWAQNYSRKQFDYAKMEEKPLPECEKEVFAQLDLAHSQIEQQQSASAVKTTEQLFKKFKNCPQVHDAHAWSLFRNGKWTEAIDIIEQAIEKFSKSPYLIERRGYINLEMAELGLGQKVVDGNSVFSPNKEKTTYTEEEFQTENYKVACQDFEYLCTNYNDRHREVMITGYIYQRLKQFDKSNLYFSKLLDNEDYKDQALMGVIDNAIILKDYTKAEALLLESEKKYPKATIIYEKLAQLYEAKNEPDKQQVYKQKGQFYSMLALNADLTYNLEDFETLTYFAKEKNTPENKMAKLKTIVEKKNMYAVDVCLAILKMHANHGNGFEDKVTNELAQMGKMVVPRTIQLFEEPNISTCTIGNLADILAVTKDTAGWRVMVNYLPKMANLPFTIIPPNVPAMLMKFDKEKGARALIEFARTLIQNEKNNEKSDSPFAELNGVFGQSLFYSPLQKLPQKKVVSIAKELQYSKQEINILLKKVYKK